MGIPQAGRMFLIIVLKLRISAAFHGSEQLAWRDPILLSLSITRESSKKSAESMAVGYTGANGSATRDCGEEAVRSVLRSEILREVSGENLSVLVAGVF